MAAIVSGVSGHTMVRVQGLIKSDLAIFQFCRA